MAAERYTYIVCGKKLRVLFLISEVRKDNLSVKYLEFRAGSP